MVYVMTTADTKESKVRHLRPLTYNRFRDQKVADVAIQGRLSSYRKCRIMGQVAEGQACNDRYLEW